MRFKAIPQIKAYMESEDFMKAPLNNKMAAFGAKWFFVFQKFSSINYDFTVDLPR